MLTKKHSFYSPSSTFPFDSSSLPPPLLPSIPPPNLYRPHKLAFRGPTDSSSRLRMKLFRVPHPVSFFLFSWPRPTLSFPEGEKREKKRERFPPPGFEMIKPTSVPLPNSEQAAINLLMGFIYAIFLLPPRLRSCYTPQACGGGGVGPVKLEEEHFFLFWRPCPFLFPSSAITAWGPKNFSLFFEAHAPRSRHIIPIPIPPLHSRFPPLLLLLRQNMLGPVNRLKRTVLAQLSRPCRD